MTKTLILRLNTYKVSTLKGPLLHCCMKKSININISTFHACLDNTFIDFSLLDVIRLYRLPLKCAHDQLSGFILCEYSHTFCFFFSSFYPWQHQIINYIGSTSLPKKINYHNPPISRYYVWNINGYHIFCGGCEENCLQWMSL